MLSIENRVEALIPHALEARPPSLPRWGFRVRLNPSGEGVVDGQIFPDYSEFPAALDLPEPDQLGIALGIYGKLLRKQRSIDPSDIGKIKRNWDASTRDAVRTAEEFQRAAKSLGDATVSHGFVIVPSPKKRDKTTRVMLFNQVRPNPEAGQLAVPIAAVIGYPALQSPSDKERINLLTGADNPGELSHMISELNERHPENAPLPLPLSRTTRFWRPR